MTGVDRWLSIHGVCMRIVPHRASFLGGWSRYFKGYTHIRVEISLLAIRVYGHAPLAVIGRSRAPQPHTHTHTLPSVASLAWQPRLGPPPFRHPLSMTSAALELCGLWLVSMPSRKKSERCTPHHTTPHHTCTCTCTCRCCAASASHTTTRGGRAQEVA